MSSDMSLNETAVNRYGNDPNCGTEYLALILFTDTDSVLTTL